MNKKTGAKCAVALLAISSGIAAAQTIPIRPAYEYPSKPSTGAASMQIPNTPLYVAPFIGAAVGHDSNLFLRPENEKSSTLYVTSPGFKLDARTAASVFQASYQGQFGRYENSREDDYNDHNARASFDAALTQRAFFRVAGDYIRGHEPRGSTDRTVQNSPDRYRLWLPSAMFAYGTPGANGRIELYYSDASRRYVNNRAATVFSDRDTREVGGAFYWKIAPRTFAVVDARNTELSYKSSLSPLSSTERRYFGGVLWEATAATSGTVKIGRLTKRFDNTYPESSKTAWEALISWKPRTYSQFDFYTGRYPVESTGLGSYILSEASGVIWNHGWSTFLNTEVNVRYQKDEYQLFVRTDDIRSIGLRAGYKFRRWLTLGAEYTYTQRDSNVSTFDYDRNLYLLTATLTL